MKLDFSNAWADAMTMLRGQLDLLIALAGVFLFLPELARALLFPFDPAAEDWPGRIAEFSAYMSENGPKLLLLSLLQAFGQAAIVALLLDRDRPTVAQALRRALPMLPWYFLTSLIVGLILIGGLFALLLPAAYLLGRIGIAPVVSVAEQRRNPFDAIRRTFQITKGNGWSAFFLIAIVWVVGYIVALAVTSIVGLVMLLAAGQSATSMIVIGIVAAFTAAILSLILLLIYIAIYRQLSAERASVAITQ